MAITAATTLSAFSGFLSREQSQPIFERTARQSVVQRLVREIPLSGNGKSIPVVTGRLSAAWVAEGAIKPASAGTMSLKNMDPKKLAVIAVVSAEVVRGNPGNYMNLIRDQIAEAFAIAFDSAALHGTSTPFTTYVDQTTQTPVELGTTAQADGGVYVDIVSGLGTLVRGGKKVTGFAFDDVAEPILLSSVDTTGRPIWIESAPMDDTVSNVRAGRLLGRSSAMGEGVGLASPDDIVGYAGDWTQAAWGVVGGISYKVSTEASVTINGSLQSLFERNLVAVLAEAEYGWLVNDVDAFLQYTDAESYVS